MYPTKKLSEIAKVMNGRAYKADELLDSGKTPVLRVGNLFTNNHWYYSDLDLEDDKYCDNGDLIYAWSASFGPFIWNGGKCIYHYHIWKILCSENIDKQYLYWYLAYQTKNLSSKGNGVGMIHITKGMIENLDVLFPPLSTQSRIVARLDSAFASIDEQISLLRANIADVENMRKSVLVETFDKNNYELLKISDIAEIINGGTPDTTISDYWNGDIFWITPKDMGRLEGIYVSETSRKITQEGVNNSSAKILPVNSVVLSSRAPIGHLAINTVPMCTNQGCKGLVPGDELNHSYLYYFLLHSRDLLNSLGSGTTFKELSSTKLKEVEIPLPPLLRQHEIVAHLDRVFAMTGLLRGEYEAQIRDLNTLKQSLLEEAFSGRLVPENEA